jgi:pimeloyl-ACP methyl ester carboxylesterase
VNALGQAAQTTNRQLNRVAAISDEYRVIAWDERGRGLSTANAAFTF